MTMKILPVNVWDTVKVVLRERCIVLQAFVKKKMNCASMQVRKLEKEQCGKKNRRKERKTDKNKLVKQGAKIKKNRDS